MGSVRSILWVGRGKDFQAELAMDAPALDIVWAHDAEAALALPLEAFDALVLDARRAEDAASELRRLRRDAGGVPVLVRLDAGEAQRRPELVEAGADDVVLRPATPDAGASAQVLERLERIARAPRRAPAPPAAAEEIVGESAPLRATLALVARASRSSATVLLTGETGTGKELLARAVHRGSARRRRPFVAVNCAAFPETLLESELFGHQRGAFTGADRDRKGLFEAAEGGTLFLDEIGETTPPFQAKLLRALQEREVRPVGGIKARRVDVRVIAASNRDLWREAAEGRFRADLYYRLAVFPVHVPPLRERPGDIARLAEHFLARHAGGRAHLALEALHLLQSYAWPGNVRELENEIQRALALAEPGEPLAPGHFSERLSGVVAPVAASAAGESLRETLGRIEAWLIRRALDAHGGRRAETARRLRITREGLYKKMKRYGIE